VREDDRGGGGLEEGEHLLELLLGARGVRGLPVEEVRPAPVEAAQAEAEARHNALVVRALDLDVEGNGEVGRHLLVDALVGLEDRVEVRTTHAVEEGIDLVLEHVLREGGEGRGHDCVGSVQKNRGRARSIFISLKCRRDGERQWRSPLQSRRALWP